MLAEEWLCLSTLCFVSLCISYSCAVITAFFELAGERERSILLQCELAGVE